MDTQADLVFARHTCHFVDICHTVAQIVKLELIQFRQNIFVLYYTSLKCFLITLIENYSFGSISIIQKVFDFLSIKMLGANGFRLMKILSFITKGQELISFYLSRLTDFEMMLL